MNCNDLWQTVHERILFESLQPVADDKENIKPAHLDEVGRRRSNHDEDDRPHTCFPLPVDELFRD
jgi:hypothetical protein